MRVLINVIVIIVYTGDQFSYEEPNDTGHAPADGMIVNYCYVFFLFYYSGTGY